MWAQCDRLWTDLAEGAIVAGAGGAVDSRLSAYSPPTVGIEEELFVIDPVSRAVTPRAAAVLRRADYELGPLVGSEYTKFQVETRTVPCADLGDLQAQLGRIRSVVADAARAEGLRIVATGTPVIGEIVPPPIAESPRYRRMNTIYGALTDEQSVCACHVHVHLPDREKAVLVSNHLRPWLPTFVAMAANSPYWAGRDTRHASWRTVTRDRWPVAGPPPFFESIGHFDELIHTLLDNQVLMDRGMVYWDVRPSAHLPTIEIRVLDVPATVLETVLFAALIRALVMVSLNAVERGDPGPRISTEILRAAYWRSAQGGLAGSGIDTRTHRPTKGTVLVEALLAHIGPGLAACGDLELVSAGWDRLRTIGCGAVRQRAAYTRRGELTDVVDFLIEQTDQADLTPSR